MVHVHDWWMLFGEPVVVGDTYCHVYGSILRVVFAAVFVAAAVAVSAAPADVVAVAVIAVHVEGCALLIVEFCWYSLI